MNVTLGVKTLTVRRISLDWEVKGSLYDAYEEGAYKRKLYALGLLRKWTLDCIEKDVAWNDSAAKYAEEKAAAGEKLIFTVSGSSRYAVDTNVYVLACIVNFEAVGAQNIRTFTITLQEA
jgi:hypothetical protein